MAKRQAGPKPKQMSASERASRRRQIAGLIFSGRTLPEVQEITKAPESVIADEGVQLERRLQEHGISADQKIFSVPQVAHVLGFLERNVRQAIERGDLPAERLGREWMILRKDAMKFMTALRLRGRPAKPKQGSKK